MIGFEEKRGEVFAEGPVQVGYLTRGQPVDSVEVVRPLSDLRPLAESEIGYSELKITRWVHNYKEMSFAGGEVSKPIAKKWPPIEFETEGARLVLESSWSDGPWDRTAAIKGLEHVLLAFAPAVVRVRPARYRRYERRVVHLSL